MFSRSLKVHGRRRSTTLLHGAIAAVVALSLASAGLAFQAKTQRPAPPAPKGTGSAAPKAGAAPTKAAPSAAPKPRFDTVAQQVVLQSPEWKGMISDFNDWLATQVFYDDQTVAQIRQRLDYGPQRMSAGQLQGFLAQMQDRLDVLYSPIAQEAEAYLTEKFAVASAAYTQRIRQRIPDVLTTSAAELNQRLVALAAKRQTKRQNQAAFDETRQQRVVANQARLQERRQAQERAVERRGRSPAIANASQENDFTPARDYFPDVGNQGGFAIPFLGGGLGVGMIW